MDRLTRQCDKLSVVSIAIVLSYRQRSGQSVNVVGELSWLQDADIAMTRRASQAQSVAIGGRSVQSEHVLLITTRTVSVFCGFYRLFPSSVLPKQLLLPARLSYLSPAW